MRRWLVRIAGALALLLVVAVGAVYALSERRLRARYDTTVPPVAIPTDSASIARGEHLARAVLNCTLCHGEDMGGTVYADMGPVGIVAGPNLTRGAGGIGASLTTGDWVRAIRHGVRRDGTSLIVMPTEEFTNLNDEDTGALIAWLRQLPGVDRTVERTRFGPVGRALLAIGEMNVLVAPKTHPPAERWRGTPAVSAEYGRYLADVAGCHGCHGDSLSGGVVAGPPGLPPASNLTPSGAIARWSDEEFVRAMRTGRRPDGSTMNEFMPWKTFANMTDDELRALLLYLRGVRPREFGNK